MQIFDTRSQKEGRWLMKPVFASLTALLLGFVVYGTTQPANEPTITIEGHQVPYGQVKVWHKRTSGRESVVEYCDPDSQIDFLERVPVAKAEEILAYQSAHKLR
jgi:hypothetical protein